MASKRRNIFYENKKQETTGTDPPILLMKIGRDMVRTLAEERMTTPRTQEVTSTMSHDRKEYGAYQKGKGYTQIFYAVSPNPIHNWINYHPEDDPRPVLSPTIALDMALYTLEDIWLLSTTNFGKNADLRTTVLFPESSPPPEPLGEMTRGETASQEEAREVILRSPAYKDPRMRRMVRWPLGYGPLSSKYTSSYSKSEGDVEVESPPKEVCEHHKEPSAIVATSEEAGDTEEEGSQKPQDKSRPPTPQTPVVAPTEKKDKATVAEEWIKEAGKLECRGETKKNEEEIIAENLEAMEIEAEDIVNRSQSHDSEGADAMATGEDECDMTPDSLEVEQGRGSRNMMAVTPPGRRSIYEGPMQAPAEDFMPCRRARSPREDLMTPGRSYGFIRRQLDYGAPAGRYSPPAGGPCPARRSTSPGTSSFRAQEPQVTPEMVETDWMEPIATSTPRRPARRTPARASCRYDLLSRIEVAWPPGGPAARNLMREGAFDTRHDVSPQSPEAPLYLTDCGKLNELRRTMYFGSPRQSRAEARPPTDVSGREGCLFRVDSPSHREDSRRSSRRASPRRSPGRSPQPSSLEWSSSGEMPDPSGVGGPFAPPQQMSPRAPSFQHPGRSSFSEAPPTPSIWDIRVLYPEGLPPSTPRTRSPQPLPRETPPCPQTPSIWDLNVLYPEGFPRPSAAPRTPQVARRESIPCPQTPSVWDLNVLYPEGTPRPRPPSPRRSPSPRHRLSPQYSSRSSPNYSSTAFDPTPSLSDTCDYE
ncbi:hypothetical protein AAG570_012088 [Ranatra chinensis]|uniref:Uncharacterized protein n=1 Tax=Ranatra chinensis TaxID=642074 RepID=A0ABD0YHZ1_9HEMI